MRYKHAFTALVIAAGFALAGCSNDGDTSNGAGAEQSETAEQLFNAVDVSFAQQMVPHHRQAIEMSDLATERAASPDVKQFAEDIAAAQAPEIETMTAWLESWGEDVPPDTTDGGGMDHSVHGGTPIDDMPGMMTTEEMDQLEATSGTEFDQMFLTMMIAHHEGAIDMAVTEQADGKNDDAVALAEKVEADQTAEITEMQALLSS